VEFTSLIARKQRLGELSESQARERLALLRLHLVEGVFGRIPIGAGHYARAAELIAAMDSPLRTLDALHLAVAIAAPLPLITADRDFAASARRHGATVVRVA
jgi:predicted nucleic acid-binding protein